MTQFKYIFIALLMFASSAIYGANQKCMFTPFTTRSSDYRKLQREIASRGEARGPTHSALFLSVAPDNRELLRRRGVNKYNQKIKKGSLQKQIDKEVLFISDILVLGGAEKAFIELINNLDIAREQMDICLLTRGGQLEQYLKKGLSIVTLQQARQRSYKTVISYSSCISPSIWITSIKAKRRVQWVHNDIRAQLKHSVLWYKKNCTGIDLFVCCSAAAARSFSLHHPSLASKVTVAYCMVDKAMVMNMAQKDISDMKRDKEMPIVVTVARLWKQKALDRAIRVHKRLEDAGIHFKWFVVGPGPLKAILEEQIKASKLQGKFVLLGGRLNPYPYIQHADIFALLSYHEGFGIVITEAKFLQKPIIVTDVAGAREQIESGYNGLIVGNDEEMIYQGLKKILTDKALQKKISENLNGFDCNNQETLKHFKEVVLDK